MVLIYLTEFFRFYMSSGNHLSFNNVPQVLYENRYCKQEGFSILACGGIDKNRNKMNQVLEVKVPSFKVVEFPFMEKRRYRTNLATISSNIFSIVDSRTEYEKLGSSCTSVEVYSEETKSWKHKYIKFEELFDYCIC